MYLQSSWPNHLSSSLTCLGSLQGPHGCLQPETSGENLQLSLAERRNPGPQEEDSHIMYFFLVPTAPGTTFPLLAALPSLQAWVRVKGPSGVGGSKGPSCWLVSSSAGVLGTSALPHERVRGLGKQTRVGQNPMREGSWKKSLLGTSGARS